ncbi:MAG: ferritin [Candidatus Omnitrophica bacterium]|nr:ferritin [Candidatus Omnitrophota bacterium]
MDKKLLKQLNDQINKEMDSMYVYFAMAAYLEANNWPGFGAWMQKQSTEEMGHVMKIYRFINDRGDQVVLDSIEKPAATYKSVKDVFQKALAHEKKITVSINKLVDAARASDDKATEIFLQWFVTEQVEEEKSVGDVLTALEMVKDAPGALIMLDHQLGARQ